MSDRTLKARSAVRQVAEAGKPTAARQREQLRRLATLYALPPDVEARMHLLLVSPNGKGWLQLVKMLQKAEADETIAASPGASGFLAIMLTLAEDAVSTVNGVDALLPIDGLLPKGAKGEKFTHPGRGEGSVKRRIRQVLPALEKRLGRKATMREVWDACGIRVGRKLKFYVHRDGSPDHIWIEGVKPMGWDRFRVSVSEVRRTLK